MDKQHIELYIGAWIDNSHGVYTQDAISEKMRQIALQFGVPKSKLPTMAETFQSVDDYEYGDKLSFYEYHDELQRELEGLLNEYCTTDLTCWAWNDNAFGLWYSWVINEEIA
jgi:hypothetical protein